MMVCSVGTLAGQTHGGSPSTHFGGHGCRFGVQRGRVDTDTTDRVLGYRLI